MDKIVDQRIYRDDGLGPGTFGRTHGCPLRQLAFLADHLAQSFNFTDHGAVEIDNFIKGVSDFTI